MNECCEQPENRLEGPGPRGLEASLPADVTVTYCTVCECRHFEVDAEPGVIGVKGAAL